MLLEQIEKQLKAYDTSRLIRLQRYYEGITEITERTFLDTTKPNNKIVNNYAAYIVDIIQGYFVGKPVSYTSTDAVFMEALQYVLNANDERVLNTSIAKQVGIKGKCYEMVYMDEQSNIQIAKINAENIIPIYSDDLKPKLESVIRVWQDEDCLSFETYDDKEKRKGIFKEGKAEYLDEDNPESWIQIFGEIPIIEYTNNDEKSGDFEKVMSLIDAYDKSRSNSANDFDYFTDAYMMLSGCNFDITADNDTLKTMKTNRLITLPEGGTASFLIKQINDVATENHNNRLRQDIHKFSFTPDLTDAQFGGSISGIALQFKLFGLEQIAQTKENYMRLGLKKRIRLINKVLNIKGGAYNENDIQMTFTRNMPVNLQELTQSMISLRGLISDETIMAHLPMIDDPAKEIAKREEEQAGKMSIDAPEPVVTQEIIPITE